MASAIVYCNSSSQDANLPQWVNLSRVEGAPTGVFATATTDEVNTTPATITVGFPAFDAFPGPVTSIEIGCTNNIVPDTEPPSAKSSAISVLGFIGTSGAAFNETLAIETGEDVRTLEATIVNLAAATAGLEAGVTGLELAFESSGEAVFSLSGVFLRATYTEGQIIGGGGDTGSAKALPLNLVLP